MASDAEKVLAACCCRPYDPETNTVHRCIARAMDLGHCRPGDCHCRPAAPKENSRG